MAITVNYLLTNLKLACVTREVKKTTRGEFQFSCPHVSGYLSQIFDFVLGGLSPTEQLSGAIMSTRLK